MNSTLQTVNSPLSSLLGYQLHRASITMMNSLRTRLKPLGFTPTLASIMIIVNENEGIIQSQVAKFLSIERSNMVSLITSLEKKGLLSKEAIDGRSQKLLVTKEGSEVLKKVYVQIGLHEEEYKLLLGEASSESMIDSLHSIWRSNQA